LLVWAAVQMIIGHRHFGEMGPHLLSSFAYLHNAFFGAFPGAINMVAWSLEIEIQFYVLVPLLALLFAIPSASIRRTVLAILMIASGFLSIVAHRNIHLRASILYYLAFFLAGFLVCDLYLTRREWKPSFRWDVPHSAGRWCGISKEMSVTSSFHSLLLCSTLQRSVEGYALPSSAIALSLTLGGCATASTFSTCW